MDSEDVLTCTLCNISLESTDHLENHLESVHGRASIPTIGSNPEEEVSNEHDTSCEYCNENFPTSELLKVHVNENHATAYLKCHSCMLRFQTKLLLSTHVKACHEPSNGSCTGSVPRHGTPFMKPLSSACTSSSTQSPAPSNSKNL